MMAVKILNEETEIFEKEESVKRVYSKEELLRRKAEIETLLYEYDEEKAKQGK